MKVLFVFLMIGFSMPLLGQSKKQQIEMLSVSKDSIQSLLDEEREAHTLSKTTLTNQIAELNNQINDLNSNSETQNARIANLEGQLKKIEVQLQVKEQENLKKDNNIQNLTNQIERLKDSLNLIQSSQAIPNPNDIVHIPDEHFKAYLIAHEQINTNGDNEIQVSEARSFNGEINLGKSQKIKDIKGIEMFTSLIGFHSEAPIKTIDISKNIALISFDCRYSDITSIDVSKNTALTKLAIGGMFSTLDVSKNTALTYLSVSAPLTNLDVNNNTELTKLYINGRVVAQGEIYESPLIKSIDLTKNIALIKLSVDAQLTNLDVSNNTALEYLSCEGNQLTSLDVSNNAALTYLVCRDNPLKCVVGCREECELEGATRCP